MTGWTQHDRQLVERLQRVYGPDLGVEGVDAAVLLERLAVSRLLDQVEDAHDRLGCVIERIEALRDAVRVVDGIVDRRLRSLDRGAADV